MELKHIIIMGAAVFATLLPAAADAATEQNFNARTTEDLVGLCSANPNDAMGTAALNFCHGFAQGAVSVEMEREAAARQAKMFCFPNPTPARSTTLGEFVRWAKANPARMSDRPADGLFAFLSERFPCPGKR
jgi:hypothetical protein